jgi:hypothetical protein
MLKYFKCEVYPSDFICIFASDITGVDLVLTAREVVCKHAVCGGASLKQCHKTTKGETNYALAA